MKGLPKTESLQCAMLIQYTIDSLKHDGPGLVGLSPAVVKYLNTGSLEEAATLVTMHDLTDLELKGLLEEKVR